MKLINAQPNLLESVLLGRSKTVPNYCEDSNDDEHYDSDVTWSMQEAIQGTVESNLNSVVEVQEQSDPLGYCRMSQGKEKRKKKKKHLGEHQEKVKKSLKKSPKVERASMKKDQGYGIGLSRGFSLWRTLKDLRLCITKVSDPLTKAQRRSLRRKLSYYVDDLERIVVGVNPRASGSATEESVSGDEEMREEVNALIDDALDEAALQGKIVQSDYFETRMSYLEKQCATLKNQLEELANKKLVEKDSSKKGSNPSNDQQSDSQACSSTSKHQEETQDFSNSSMQLDGLVEEEIPNEKGSCNLSQDQQSNGQACSSTSVKKQKQKYGDASSKQLKVRRTYVKRMVEELEESNLGDEKNVQEVGLQKEHVGHDSHSSLSLGSVLPAAAMKRFSNEGSEESLSVVEGDKPENPEGELVNSEDKTVKTAPDLSAWTALGNQPDKEPKIQEFTKVPFKNWVVRHARGRPKKKTSTVPRILKRLNMNY